MLKKLFSHSLVYGLAPQIPRIAFIFILPLITPFLTKTDYGVFGVVTAYSAMLSSLNSLGLSVIISNSFYKHPERYKYVWRQIYGFLIYWNIFYALLIAIVIYYALPIEAMAHRNQIILLVALPIVFFGPTRLIGQLYFQLNRKPLQVGIRAAVIGSIAVLLNYIFIAEFKMGYMGFFYSTFISSILYNLSYVIVLNFRERISPIFNFKWRLIRKNLEVSLPLVPHSFGAYLNGSSDRVVLKELKIPTADIGAYNFEYSFSDVFNSGSMAINTAISPLMLQNYKDKNDEANKYLIFSWAAAFFGLATVASIWLKEIFSIFVKNDELSSLYPMTIILIMAVCYRPLYVAGVQKLFYIEKTNIIFKVTLFGGLLNILLNLIFIPFYGYEAAIISTFISYLYQGYIFYSFKTFKENNSVNFMPLFWLALQILLTIIAFIIVDQEIYIKILFSVLIIAIAMWSVLKFSKKLQNAQ